jgi:hypothetical protein
VNRVQGLFFDWFNPVILFYFRFFGGVFVEGATVIKKIVTSAWCIGAAGLLASFVGCACWAFIATTRATADDHTQILISVACMCTSLIGSIGLFTAHLLTPEIVRIPIVRTVTVRAQRPVPSYVYYADDTEMDDLAIGTSDTSPPKLVVFTPKPDLSSD